jgi:large subunit ribosomal protein L10
VKRAEKTVWIDEMHAGFEQAPHAVLARFTGLTANQANELRRRVRAAGGKYTVLQNRLAKRAAAGTAVERLSDQFSGPCALAVHPTDPVGLAKTLADFTKDNPQIEILVGLVDAKEVVDAQGVKRLATLPSLPELRAQLLAVIQTPATMLVRLIGTPGTQMARVLDARREKLEGNPDAAG